jgi:hypothetical protein
VTTSDSDGVDVTISAAAESGGPTLLYTRVGRLGSAVQVKLVAEDGRVLDRAELSAQRRQEGGSRYVALPSTGQLVVQIGPAALGLADALADQEAADGSVTSGVVQIVDIESLPIDWFGYEAVDILVLTTGDVAFCERLVADAKRFDALRRWLELGGRLVVCAGRTAPKLLAAGMPLAEFVPGKFTEFVCWSRFKVASICSDARTTCRSWSGRRGGLASWCTSAWTSVSRRSPIGRAAERFCEPCCGGISPIRKRTKRSKSWCRSVMTIWPAPCGSGWDGRSPGSRRLDSRSSPC